MNLQLASQVPNRDVTDGQVDIDKATRLRVLFSWRRKTRGFPVKYMALVLGRHVTATSIIAGHQSARRDLASEGQQDGFHVGAKSKMAAWYSSWTPASIDASDVHLAAITMALDP